MSWRMTLRIAAFVLMAVGAWEVLSAYYAAWRSGLPGDDYEHFGQLAMWLFYTACLLWTISILLLLTAWRHRRQRSN